jgi:trehalose 2-sulfotransferase
VTAPAPPTRGYAICAEARAGTIYLCRLLASTGRLGKPAEFFHDPLRARALASDPDGELAKIAQQAATPNGVYGIKLFSAHFDLVAKSRWAERLPGLALVHVRRRDLLGQAVSLARAIQTRQYKAGDAPSGEPRYDPALIADCLARTAYGQARWECWFARNGVEPLRLDYEDVVGAPEAAVAAVARLVGIEEAPAVDWSRVELRVQRDDQSEEWRRRFAAERADRSYLDGGRLFSRWRRGPAFARFFLGGR